MHEPIAKHRLDQLIGIVLVTLGILLIMAIAGVPAAGAEINHREDTSGQLVYESQQTLVDQRGHEWEARMFQHFRSDGSSSLCLQLTGRMGEDHITRNRPLRLTLSNGQVIQAPDTSCDIFPNASPAPHLAQYSLQAFVAELRATTSLHLSIPDQAGPIEIDVPQTILDEWKAIASCSGLYCDTQR
jgi:hypothetical protein